MLLRRYHSTELNLRGRCLRAIIALHAQSTSSRTNFNKSSSSRGHVSNDRPFIGSKSLRPVWTPSDWRCPYCRHPNTASHEICHNRRCQRPRPPLQKMAHPGRHLKTDESGPGPELKRYLKSKLVIPQTIITKPLLPGDWECKFCMGRNFGSNARRGLARKHALKCFHCGEPKPRIAE